MYNVYMSIHACAYQPNTRLYVSQNACVYVRLHITYVRIHVVCMRTRAWLTNLYVLILLLQNLSRSLLLCKLPQTSTNTVTRSCPRYSHETTTWARSRDHAPGTVTRQPRGHGHEITTSWWNKSMHIIFPENIACRLSLHIIIYDDVYVYTNDDFLSTL